MYGIFWSGFTLVRYAKRWKIYEFTSTYSGAPPPSGLVGKTTIAEYEGRLR